MSSRNQKWGPVRSLLALAPVLLGGPWYAYNLHYNLPLPVLTQDHPLTSSPHPSELTILAHTQHLSETIGFRTVGTREHAEADKWMVGEAEKLKKLCKGVTELDCEIWHQVGSGSHRFDMMSKRLYKTYVDLTNVVIRISASGASTPEKDPKAHAVLVNCHLDSTLPGPGAADDAISCGVMLEIARTLVEKARRGEWKPEHSVVFLFNHAEESLQDGSHLFSTQHPIRNSVRAIINLEAAGTEGREILFQATSEQMIMAYSKVPRPFGTIFANDIFSSGVLLSDTDFRQFEQYLNVTGLDMAIIGNSYLYHMRKDLVEHIQPGVAQNMAENTLALLMHLTSSESPLPSLTEGYTRPTTVFFTHLGVFWVYSFATAKVMYVAFLLASIGVAYAQPSASSPSVPTPAKKGKGHNRNKSKGKAVAARAAEKTESLVFELTRGTAAMTAGIVGAVVVPNIVALFMARVLGKGMSWFSVELSGLALYGPPAFLGCFASQLFFAPISEQTVFTTLMLTQAFACTAIQFAGIGSAAVFFLNALPLTFAVAVDAVLRKVRGSADISLWTYAIGTATPLITGTQMLLPILDVFVPLTGRIGAGAPADNIVATIVSVLGSLTLPLTLAFVHRFGRSALVRLTVVSALVTGVAMAVFAMRQPFDAMHQKRLFVLHMDNVTDDTRSLNIAAADGAPGFETLVNEIGEAFGTPGGSPVSVAMDDYNSEWDSLYPFSAFITPYKIDLPAADASGPPWNEGGFTISAVNDVVDTTAGTRSFTIRIDHPGVIWTVIAFDAHVLQWNLDDSPPDEYVRHHVKEASFYGVDTWTVDLVIKLPDSNDTAPLAVNYVGIIEKGMWPGKKEEKAGGGRGMVLLEELDGWLDIKTAGTIDPMLLACVGGITTI